jgi:hypothetical protein
MSLIGSMNIMSAVFQGFWVDLEQLEELQFEAMLRILRKASMMIGEQATVDVFGEEVQWKESLRALKAEGEMANEGVLHNWFAEVMNQAEA